jgi:predicted RNase H-like nuclease (RuvC/YqgF family)
MKTTIDIHHYSSDVDLSDIGAMVRRYCREVEQLEERIEELERENAELKERLQEKI